MEEARARRPTIEVHPTIEPMQDDATTIVTHVGASLFVPGHATATILCEADGEEPISYRWYKDDHLIRGEENERSVPDSLKLVAITRYNLCCRFEIKQQSLSLKALQRASN